MPGHDLELNKDSLHCADTGMLTGASQGNVHLPPVLWNLWFQNERQREWVHQKPLKLLNFPFIKARLQTRTRWPLPSSHLRRWPTHKNMRWLWGMCIKLHVSQCKEARQGLWGDLRISLHWLQWDTYLPKPRLRIRHSTPSPERCLVHLFCACMELPGSKTSFVIGTYKSYTTSCSPAFADSPPGHSGLQ